MIKHVNENLDETIYTETLANGLTLVVLNKKNNVSTSVYLAFPYGSLQLNQVDSQGNNYVFNPGLAHFLEHKLFENHKGLDVMERFSELSCNVNAFTSYNETVYFFNTTVTEIKEPIDLLLDFVQELNITQASVEKEKSIIIQELRMYHQIPESRLMYETFQALYANLPIKYDIGGSEESVNLISKAELDLCYELNYHPSKTLMVIVSSLDPEMFSRLVNANQSKKTFVPYIPLKKIDVHEPDEVVYPEKIIAMDIQSTKLTYSFKLHPQELSNFQRAHLEWRLKIYLELLFSSINPDYARWIKEGIIHDYFGYDVEINEDYWYVMFYGETEDKETFVNLIEHTLDTDLSPLLPFLKQLKRRYLSYAYRLLDDQDDYAVQYIRSHFNALKLEDTLAIIHDLNEEDILSVKVILNTNNKTTVIIQKDQTDHINVLE